MIPPELRAMLREHAEAWDDDASIEDDAAWEAAEERRERAAQARRDLDAILDAVEALYKVRRPLDDCGGSPEEWQKVDAAQDDLLAAIRDALAARDERIAKLEAGLREACDLLAATFSITDLFVICVDAAKRLRALADAGKAGA